ncbi:hypothetical protein Tco_0194891 [Tanacetum coccineum]
MFESGTYKSLPEHVALYKALKASMERANRDEFLAEKDKEAPSSSSKQKSVPHSEQPVEYVPIPDDMNISDSEDTDTAHLSKIKTRLDWLKPVPEEDKPTTPKPDWVIPPNDLSKTENKWANALAGSHQDPDEYKLLWQTGDMSSFINCISLQFQMEEYHLLLTDQVDLFNPEGHLVVPDVSKPLPLGGPPGQKVGFIHIQAESGSISRLWVEELVPSLWIESEHDYDISVAYGISHWWFKHKEFYITRHSAPSDHSTVRSYMRILSVVSLKTYERYGYTFLKEIVLRRADYNEYKISEAYFKNLHRNDFEDLYMLHFQDYTIVSKPRAVIYRDINDQKKMMRETEVHKFSDGTLNRIMDKLDHMLKDFKLFKYNIGMETRIWSEDDRRRSKEFMEVIKRRLKIKRISRSIESFVGGRLRDVIYRLIQRTE